MRHQKAGRKLGRNATHRLAMKRNLTRSLIEHGRIITTEQKAKELRPFVEKLITLAKRGVATGDPIKALHARRLVMARLGPVAKVEFYDDEELPTGETVINKLFNEIVPRFRDRPGGYTRIIKRHERRLGDAGVTAFIELLKEGEVKVRASAKKEQAAAPAPAPMIAPEPAPEAPAPESPPPQTSTPPAP
jgi:large subunit ribosomal protein L17